MLGMLGFRGLGFTEDSSFEKPERKKTLNPEAPVKPSRKDTSMTPWGFRVWGLGFGV